MTDGNLRPEWQMLCFEYMGITKGKPITFSKSIELLKDFHYREISGLVIVTAWETAVEIKVEKLMDQPETMFFTQVTQSTPDDYEQDVSIATNDVIVSVPTKVKLSITAKNIAGHSGRVFVRLFARIN